MWSSAGCGCDTLWRNKAWQLARITKFNYRRRENVRDPPQHCACSVGGSEGDKRRKSIVISSQTECVVTGWPGFIPAGMPRGAADTSSAACHVDKWNHMLLLLLRCVHIVFPRRRRCTTIVALRSTITCYFLAASMHLGDEDASIEADEKLRCNTGTNVPRNRLSELQNAVGEVQRNWVSPVLLAANTQQTRGSVESCCCLSSWLTMLQIRQERIRKFTTNTRVPFIYLVKCHC